VAQIFADSFESGDTSAWDSSSGTPTVSEASALVGTYGCEFNADAEYVTDLRYDGSNMEDIMSDLVAQGRR
jgi:hypothetical protein